MDACQKTRAPLTVGDVSPRIAEEGDGACALRSPVSRAASAVSGRSLRADLVAAIRRRWSLNRAELQRLSTERIGDARALLDASRWPAAYYLAGYSLECALKSCVLARVERDSGVIFEDKGYSQKCWTHDLEKLVTLADLAGERDNATVADPNLGQNWLIAKDWSESSRYQISTQLQAEKLFNAISDNTHGVFQWLKNSW